MYTILMRTSLKTILNYRFNRLQKLLPRHQENAFVKGNSRTNRQYNVSQKSSQKSKGQSEIRLNASNISRRS